MISKKKILAFAAVLILSQVLIGCNKSAKPFPDNTFEWNPRTEKAFPDNTGAWKASTEQNTEKQKTANSNTQTNPTAKTLFVITQLTSFRGVVPCSDCENIELILTLRPDQVFLLRKEFNRQPKRLEDRSQEIGGWQINPDSNELLLKRGNGIPQRLAITNSRQLEVLNAEGQSIANNNDYVLNRMENAMQLIDSAELSGLYFEDGGRGYWLECQSGVTWPVARAGQYAQLSKKYNSIDNTSDKTTRLTDVTGHLVQRRDDSKSTTEYLVVDEIKQMSTGSNCSTTNK